MGANYQYGHAIDDATSVNGSSGTVVQDWQNLAAQEGHSALDVRHQVSGNYLFELPFGPDKLWVTSGVGSHILEGFSISGSVQLRHRELALAGLRAHVAERDVRQHERAAAQSDRAIGDGGRRLAAQVVQHGGLLGAGQHHGLLRLLRQRAAQLD